MSAFDMELYLKLTKADELICNCSEPNSVPLLKALVSQHVLNVNYQNYELLTTKKITDMTPGSLLERLLVNKKGGMCYETMELLYHVLVEFKFDVKRVGVTIPVDPSERSQHSVLIANISNQMFLIDVGYGNNSVRVPLEFSFEETEEITVMPGEKYQLACEKDNYSLNMWKKGEWKTLYCFARPLHYISYEESTDNYFDMVLTPQISIVRDCVLFVGIINVEGRIGFSCEYDTEKGATNFNMLSVKNGVVNSTEMDVESFCEAVAKYGNVEIKTRIDGDVVKFY